MDPMPVPAFSPPPPRTGEPFTASPRLSTLRAALLTTSPATGSRTMSPSYARPSAAASSRVGSTPHAGPSTTRIARPLAKVALVQSGGGSDKEEGEISDDNEPPRPSTSPPPRKRSLDRRPDLNNARAGPSRPPAYVAGPRRHSPPRRADAGRGEPFRPPEGRRRLSTGRGPPPPKPVRYAASPPVGLKPPVEPPSSLRRVSPAGSGGSSIAAAAADLSPDAARQYMAHIRELLNDGVPPDSLIRRGATSKYVTAVCEEIVVSTKKRRALWDEPRNTRADSEVPTVTSVFSLPIGALHPGHTLAHAPQAAETPSVGMERTGSHGSETSAESQLLPPLSPPNTIPQSMPNAHTLRLRPTSTWTPTPGRNQQVSSELSRPGLPPTSTEPILQISAGTSQSADSPTDLESPTTAIGRDADTSTRNALLLARRKALLSLRSRRVHASPDKVLSPLPPVETNPTNSGLPTAIQRAIAQEVDALEREMMALQSPGLVPVAESTGAIVPDEGATPVSVPMEIDLSPEEGEILPSLALPVRSVRISSTTTYATSSVSISRGIKRPGAEDLDTRPTSIKSVPLRRRVMRVPFAEQNPANLLINLDDASSGSDSDEDGGATPVIQVLSAGLETERLLKEKDAEIERLRAEIKRRLEAGRLKGKSPVPSIEAIRSSARAAIPAGTGIEQGIVMPSKEREEEDVSMEEDENPVNDPVGHDGDNTTTDDRQTVAQDPDVIEQVAPSPQFNAYQPILPRYPGLLNAGLVTAYLHSLPIPLSPIRPTSIDGAQPIDAALMRSIILTRIERARPGVVLCAAEAAGGMCADGTCANIHLLSGRGLEVTESDVVEYLCNIAPVAADATLARDALDTAAVTVSSVSWGTSRKTVQKPGSAGQGKESLANTDKLAQLVWKARDILVTSAQS